MKRLMMVMTLVLLAGVVYWALSSDSDAPAVRMVQARETTDQASSDTAVPTPLAEVLDLARAGLANLEANVTHYTARIIKQENVGGNLTEAEEMVAKIQNPGRGADDQPLRPMRVYLKYLAPKGVVGREVIWCEDQNQGQLVVHEGGLLGVMTLKLDPRGMLAMRGNRHSIDHLGLAHLTRELIARGEGVSQESDVEVRWSDGHRVGDRTCRLIEIVTKEKNEALGFYRAEIAIDLERTLPLHYAAYDWPASEGAEPKLQESYTYMDVVLNPPLTDADFDPENPEYAFP